MRCLGPTSDSVKRQSMEAPEAYHLWFYDNLVWKQRTWVGVPIQKSPLDLWNYQEIIFALRPDLIIEFGSAAGGSALFFADVLNASQIESGKVISVDVTLASLHPRAKACPKIGFVEASSTDKLVQEMLLNERRTVRRAFAILDSDHGKTHVYDEMTSLRPVLRPGDYLVVEDGNINGHPVLPEWGAGPFEALAQYMTDYPGDYEYDRQREAAFGWTFAPNGFLIRQ